jgi:nucleotide-binding universal stress UspA family protein
VSGSVGSVKGFQRVLVPIDFSPASSRARDLAGNLVAPDGVLKLLHVVEWVPTLVEGAMGGYAPARDVRVLHEDSEKKLLEAAKSSAAPRVEVEVVEGTPAPSILEVAKRDGSDLIVIGTHGHTGLDHWLLGSVTEKILRRAPGPVLTVRA